MVEYSELQSIIMSDGPGLATENENATDCDLVHSRGELNVDVIAPS